MVYLKTLLYNFLIIFFADHLIPGITASSKKLPQLGGDIIFAVALAFLNSLIYPILKLVRQEPTGIRIALVSLVLNFAAYAVVKISSVGVNVTSVEGYVLASVVASIGGFITNFYEARRNLQNREMPQ